jgi:hypothetical protein
MDGNWKTYQVKALRATYISDISAGMTSMITQKIWSVSHTCILPLNYDIFDFQKIKYMLIDMVMQIELSTGIHMFQ